MKIGIACPNKSSAETMRKILVSGCSYISDRDKGDALN
jgi:hypothetical protein